MSYSNHIEALHRRKQIDFVTTLDDAADFSAALSAAFPKLKFLLQDYWAQYVDWDLHEKRRLEENERVARGESRRWYGLPFRDPKGEPLKYHPSMTDPKIRSWRAWFEPEGWVPHWIKRSDGTHYIESLPSPQIWYSREDFYCSGRPDGRYRFARPPASLSDDDVVILHRGSLYGGYYADDASAKSFVMKVFRIAEKLSTRSVIKVHKETLQPLGLDAVNGSCRIGLHAAAWSRERRHNYFQYFSKADGYPYDPSEVFPDAKAYYAKLEAEGEAHYQRLLAQLTPASKGRRAPKS